MRSDTKLARIRQLMAAEEWAEALKLAAKFQRLGPQTEAIQRAANALANSNVYEQLGYDVEQLLTLGIVALKERYSESWKQASEDAATEKEVKHKSQKKNSE